MIILFILSCMSAYSAVPTPFADYDDPCCKHCGFDSKPCGNTCIELGDSCHVNGGCACY